MQTWDDTLLPWHLVTLSCVDSTGKLKQEELAEKVLEELRAKLKWTQDELEAQRVAERQRQLQVGVQGKSGHLWITPWHWNPSRFAGAGSQCEDSTFLGSTHGFRGSGGER